MDLEYCPPDGSRVLSIQSSVVHGYVGNKSAVFPLQLLGYDVDPIHSVQFSNHTGYDTFKGEVMNGAQLKTLIDGLAANGLLGSGVSGATAGSGGVGSREVAADGGGDQAPAEAASAALAPGSHVGYTHLLTGYCGSVSFLRAVAATAARLRASGGPPLRWVCDPVLGDGGKLYVPEALVPVYAEEVVPHAAVLTPNQFEAQLLSGIGITGMADARRACAVLHAKGPLLDLVVLTSLDFEPTEEEALGGPAVARAREALGPTVAAEVLAGGSITMLASQRQLGGDGGDRPLRQWCMSFPRIHGHYTGTGDLTAALLLAYSSRFPTDLPSALRCAGASMQAVLLRTLRDAAPGAWQAKASEDGPKSIGGCVGELRLVASRRQIEIPPLDGVLVPRTGGLRMPPLVVVELTDASIS